MERLLCDSTSIDEVEQLRRQLDHQREVTVQLLHLANSPDDLQGLMRHATQMLQEWSGCTAVGIRLREGDDFPYFETRGFPAEFIEAENRLCVCDQDGQMVRDSQGNPVLECMCGNILCGRVNSALPFFSPGGSFWTNSTSRLLASTTEADRQARTRNRCNGEGYESVALVPLRADGTTFGLLQLNDHRPGRFTAELIAAFETLGAALAEGIARRLAVKGLRETNELLEAVKNAQSLFITESDPKEVFGGLLEILVKATRSEYGFLDEVVCQEGEPVCKRSLAISDISWDESSRHLFEKLRSSDFVFPNLENLAGAPAVSGQVVIANDPAHDSRSHGMPAGHPALDCFLGIPMYYGGEIVGVAGVANRAGGYTQEIAKFLEPLTAACAGMIAALRSRRIADEAREALGRSQNELRAIYDSSPIMMCVLDAERRLLYMNRTMAEFIGRPEEELRGQRACGIIGCLNALEDPRGCGYGRDCVSCTLRLALLDTIQTGKPCRMIERRMTIPSGGGSREVVLLAATALIQTELGANLLISLEDVTERDRAEQAFRESEGRFHKMFREHDAIMLLIESETGEIRDANQAASRFYGYTREQLCQMTIQQINTLPAEEVASQRGLAFERNRNYFIFPHRLASGEVRTVEVHSTPIPIQDELILLSIIHDITDRERAEEALRESECLLRDLAANLPGAVYQFVRRRDGSYEIPFMSEGGVDLLGRPLEELQNPALLFAGVHPDDLAGMWQSIEESAGTLQPWRHEFRIAAAGGEQKWLRGASNPSLRPDGSICWNGVLLDFTDRRQAEEAVRVMAKMLDVAPSAITIHDFEGRFLYANRKTFDLHGYEASEFMALNLRDVDVPESSELIPDRLRMIEERGEAAFEVAHRCKDGSTIPLEIAAKRVVWSGRPAVLSVGTDITERKLAEESLRESETRYRLLTENSLFPVVVTSLVDNTVLFTNACADRYFEIRPGSAVGRSAPDFWCDLAVRDRLVRRLLQGVQIHAEEVCLRSSSGRQRSVLISITRIEFDGTPAAFSVLSDITERKRNEEALRESEQRYRSLFDNAIMGVALHEMILDDRGNPVDYVFLQANAAFEWQTGLKLSGVLGKRVTEVLPAGDTARFISTYGRVVLTGESIAFETFSAALNRHYNISAYRVAPRRFATVFLDITDRVRVAEALSESEERYRRIVLMAQEGIWAMDADHRTSFVNPRMAAMLGYEPDEMLGKPVESFMYEEDLIDHAEQMKERHAGQSGKYEHRFRCKDDSEIRTMVSATALTDEGGRFAGSIAMFTDISDLKRTEETLRQNERLLSQAEEIIGMGSFVWEVTSDGFTSSSGMRRLFGVAETEFPKRLTDAIERLVHPDDRERVSGEAERFVKDCAVHPLEFRIVRADGEERVVHCEFEPILDNAGRLDHLVGTLHDITRRRADETRISAMQVQLHHTSRLAVMGELAAGVAHEVNQPLCSIVNFAKACKNLTTRDPADLDRIRQWLDAITTASNRAGDIVHRLLGFARRETPVCDPVSTRHLIDDAVLLIRHEARSHRVAIQIETPEDDLVVRVHPVRIQQVLVNLLRNSIEALSTAIAPEKRILVTAERLADSVEISVADNGVGVPESELQRLFEPFYTTKSQGLGLGLAISRTIVEDHGRSITAALNSTGGLTFRFTLPTGKTPVEDV